MNLVPRSVILKVCSSGLRGRTGLGRFYHVTSLAQMTSQNDRKEFKQKPKRQEKISQNVPLIVQQRLKDKTKFNHELEQDTDLENLDKHLRELDKKIKDLELRGNNSKLAQEIKRDIDNGKELIKGLGDPEEIDEIYHKLREAGNRRVKKLKEIHPLPYLGTADTSEPVSDVPCPGCGTPLHCRDPTKPGYLPSELYKPLLSDLPNLKRTVCHRCNLIQTQNIALDVKVHPDEFVNLIKEIRHKKALIVLIVDLTDFPNSMMKNLRDMISDRHHVYVVGNKVDLIPNDGKRFEERLTECIQQYCDEIDLSPLVKYIILTSTKTGYGIEQLVSKIMNKWGRKGDVYLVGSTNVGKSSMFNALIQTDFCKAIARDYIHHATTSVWPGTTLNLLKFPVVNATKQMLYERTIRLQEQRKLEHLETASEKKEKIVDRIEQKFESVKGKVGITFEHHPNFRETKISPYLNPNLISYSCEDDQVTESDYTDDRMKQAILKSSESRAEYESHLNESSRWCYDTPGIINPEQTINLLTRMELQTLVEGKSLIEPRSFILKPGMTLFVSGLGRIDYLEGDRSIYFTCFSPLGCFDVLTENADREYTAKVDGNIFQIPAVDRTKPLPPLVGQDISLHGNGWRSSTADIVLSSAGWVAVTAGMDMLVKLRAYTPEGLGCRVRSPALLPYSVNKRGKRIPYHRKFAI